MEWGAYVDAFLMVADREGGNMPVMPFGGGFMEQPVKTMYVFRVIQSVFAEKLHEEMDAIKTRMNYGR